MTSIQKVKKLSILMLCYKMKAYGHGELNTEKFTDVKYIKEKIENGIDFFSDIPLKKINLDSSFPDYILKNKEKFREFII